MSSKRQSVVIESAEAEAVMYLGPSLPNGLLNHAVLYVGGVLPQYVQDLIDGNNDIKALTVPVSKIAEIKSNLRNKSSLDHARFVRITETYKGA